MKQIKKLLSAQEAVGAEIAELEKLRQKAADDLLLVASPSISVADARTKIFDARYTIDLADSKLGLAKPQFSQLESELMRILPVVAAEWNESVKAARKAIEDDICTSSLPWFNNDEAACRRWWQAGLMSQIPVRFKFLDAAFDETIFRHNGRMGARGHAENLLRHVEKHARLCGLEPFLKREFSV